MIATLKLQEKDIATILSISKSSMELEHALATVRLLQKKVENLIVDLETIETLLDSAVSKLPEEKETF